MPDDKHYLYKSKDSGEFFSRTPIADSRKMLYGDMQIIPYPMSSSISIQNFIDPEVSKTPIYALKNTLNRKALYSTHYSFDSEHGNKGTQPLTIVSLPSTMYGSSIKKGSVDLSINYTGDVIARIQDVNNNGELIETTGSNVGEVAGVVLYDEGFIVLTGSWDNGIWEFVPQYVNVHPSNIFVDEYRSQYKQNVFYSSSSGICFISESNLYFNIENNIFPSSNTSSLVCYDGITKNTIFQITGGYRNLNFNQGIYQITSHSSGMYGIGSGMFSYNSPFIQLFKWDGSTIQNVTASYGNPTVNIWAAQGIVGEDKQPSPFLFVRSSGVNTDINIIGAKNFGNSPKLIHVSSYFSSSLGYVYGYSPNSTITGTVYTGLSCSDGVYIGGMIKTNYGYQNVIKWDGTNWITLGTSSIESVDNRLSYCNSILSYSSGIYCNFRKFGINKWDGSNWTTIITGSDNYIRSFASSSDGIYYNLYLSDTDNIIYKWNGTTNETVAWADTLYYTEEIKDFILSNENIYVISKTDLFSYIFNIDLTDPKEDQIYTYNPEYVDLKWLSFGTGSNFAMTTASFNINFDGTNEIHTLGMFSYAEKDEFNCSNNPTFVDYEDSYKLTSEVATNGYYEPDNVKIKNTKQYKYENYTGSLEKQTFISKIGIYDENKNLIAIAKLATPVKKNIERDYLFKLKLDL